MNLIGFPEVLIRKYRLVMIFVLVFTLTVILFNSTVSNLLELWLQFDESQGHGLLVVLVSIYLIYCAFQWKDNRQIRPAYIGFFPLLFCSLLWAISNSVDINIVQQMLLPLIFITSVYLLAGKKIARRIIVPVLLLYFAIPVWDYLNESLLGLTTVVVQWLVQLSDITAFIEGNSIFLPFGEVLIASGCSGLRYFVIGFFLSVLSSYLYFDRNITRFLLISMTISLSLLANWVRVYGIIIIAYQTEMQSALIANHETLGWILFMIFMVPLFYINYRYQSRNPDKENVQQEDHIFRQHSYIPAFILFVAAIVSGPVIANIYGDNEYQNTIPMPGGNDFTTYEKKTEKDFVSDLWIPNIDNPYISVESRTVINDHVVYTIIYGYKRDFENKEILPYTSNIVNRDKWAVKQQESLILDVSDNAKERFKKLVLLNKYSARRIVLYYNYDIGGYVTDTYNFAKLLQIPATLSDNAYAKISFIWSECNKECRQISNLIETRMTEFTGGK